MMKPVLGILIGVLAVLFPALTGTRDVPTTTAEVVDAENNFTNIIWSNNDGLNATETPPVVTCEVARIKCALRQGCGAALKVSGLLD